MRDNEIRSKRTVLCPVDFSDASERAMIHSAEKYSKEAELVILHVGSPATSDYDTMLKEHLHRFSRYSGELSDFGCNARFAVEYGSPAETIISYAKTNGIDLIVMGSHGENNIHRLLVGSTTETVMRHAPCPVLVYKTPDTGEAAVRATSEAL